MRGRDIPRSTHHQQRCNERDNEHLECPLPAVGIDVGLAPVVDLHVEDVEAPLATVQTHTPPEQQHNNNTNNISTTTTTTTSTTSTTSSIKQQYQHPLNINNSSPFKFPHVRRFGTKRRVTKQKVPIRATAGGGALRQAGRGRTGGVPVAARRRRLPTGAKCQMRSVDARVGAGRSR